MNNWTKFVTNFYREKKRTNKNYKFKDAMKDARGEYKKGGSAGAAAPGAAAAGAAAPFASSMDKLASLVSNANGAHPTAQPAVLAKGGAKRKGRKANATRKAKK